MHGDWLQDLESLEAIPQDDGARRIFLRMAAMSREGRLPAFLAEVGQDDELDASTKDAVIELARDHSFLLAVEDYVIRTHRLH
ncbi:MAG: hypothetical protein ACRDOG_08135 [Gaiellaceae bacterium]